ncbi:MAG: hypothetical protein AB8B97_27495 [Granulosicoccus sp.]
MDSGSGMGDGFSQFDCTLDASPTDTDNDGLTDCEEIITYRTNLLLADTDGDGFNDRIELPSSACVLTKNPSHVEDMHDISLPLKLFSHVQSAASLM